MVKAYGVKEQRRFRTSLRIPEAASEKIKESMQSSNYGVRERSKWICEALESLAEKDSYWDLIAEEFMDQGDNDVIPVTMDEHANGLLLLTAKSYTEHTGKELVDQSVILRTAIIQRLVSEGGGLVSM